VADGVLTTDELTILIGPAAASPARAVAATAPQMAAKTLDLICLFIAISFFRVPDRPNMTLRAPQNPAANQDAVNKCLGRPLLMLNDTRMRHDSKPNARKDGLARLYDRPRRFVDGGG
jgi:hypothetical protein